MRRSLWVPLPPGTLLDDVYVPLKSFFQGYRILYEPTATMYDFPTVLQSEFQRKVRLQAGPLPDAEDDARAAERA